MISESFRNDSNARERLRNGFRRVFGTWGSMEEKEWEGKIGVADLVTPGWWAPRSRERSEMEKGEGRVGERWRGWRRLESGGPPWEGLAACPALPWPRDPSSGGLPGGWALGAQSAALWRRPTAGWGLAVALARSSHCRPRRCRLELPRGTGTGPARSRRAPPWSGRGSDPWQGSRPSLAAASIAPSGPPCPEQTHP